MTTVSTSEPLTTIAALRMFLRPVMGERLRLCWVAVALILLALSQGAFLLALGPLVKALFASADDLVQLRLSDLFPPTLLTWIGVDGGVGVSRPLLAALAPTLIVAAGLAKAAASYVYQYNQQSLAYIVAAVFRSRIFSAIVHLPLLRYQQRSTGAWMSMIMNDVHFLQVRIADVATSLLRDGVAIVSCLIFLSFLHWQSALLLALLTPIFVFVLGRVGRRIAGYADLWQQALAQLSALVLELRTRFDFVRAQHAEEFELRRFARRNDDYYKMIRRSLAVRAAFAPGLELVGTMLFALLIWLVRRGDLGAVRPEDLLRIFAAMGLMFRPWRSVGEQYAAWQETLGALRASIAATTSVEQAASLAARRVVTDGVARIPVISIRRLVGGFANRAQFAAENIALAPGRSVAVIGPSGGGKSTLLRTLAGLYEPMTWDADHGWRDVADLAAFVSQEPFLFAGTLRENLLYGLSAAQVVEANAKMQQVIAMMQLDADIARLASGLDSEFKLIGGNFSGGQVQRLVMARMLLRQKPLWLLDEATSAVDAAADRDLCRAIVARARRELSCVVWVTHRLQHLETFDEVWFVEAGHLKWQGRHADLLSNDRYRAYTQAHE